MSCDFWLDFAVSSVGAGGAAGGGAGGGGAEGESKRAPIFYPMIE